MITPIKNVVSPFVPKKMKSWLKEQNNNRQLIQWQKEGCPDPPPHIVKQNIIKDYQAASGYNTLIETGTYRGAMIEAQKKTFNKVISIELGMELYKAAVKRFSQDKNVTIVQGDSGKVLSNIIKDLHEPAIFWLDGHYSAGVTALGDKECPIYEEIDAIFDGKAFNHILLVDDARCFIGKGDYPSIDELTAYVQKKNKSYSVSVEHDIIRYEVK